MYNNTTVDKDNNYDNIMIATSVIIMITAIITKSNNRDYNAYDDDNKICIDIMIMITINIIVIMMMTRMVRMMMKMIIIMIVRKIMILKIIMNII